MHILVPRLFFELDLCARFPLFSVIFFELGPKCFFNLVFWIHILWFVKTKSCTFIYANIMPSPKGAKSNVTKSIEIQI